MTLPLNASPNPASQRFRFRFVARQEPANTLVTFAIESLRECHPSAGILLVDANEKPAFSTLRIAGDFEVIHLPPETDEVARVVGRGSRHHLYYWRHSPQLRNALPPGKQFDVHADADIVFLRPMDLGSLVGPLSRGRIAATIDESTLEHYQRLEQVAATSVGTMFPVAGCGGPLLQGGLIFTNPMDDGGFYNQFWDAAVKAARENQVREVPWDDMGIITALLGNGGPLWERLLPLGHEWNYITDSNKDPGIFGCAAHYGGRTAQALSLRLFKSMFATTNEAGSMHCWGTAADAGSTGLVRARWTPDTQDCSSCVISVGLPFALSWNVPAATTTFKIAATLEPLTPPAATQAVDATFFVHVNGRLHARYRAAEAAFTQLIEFPRAETVTLIGISGSRRRINLEYSFA